VQAGVLGGDVEDILLLDVTPTDPVDRDTGRCCHPQIERNTTIPTRKVDLFSTASDNQTQVEIHVVQGERPMAADNKSAGPVHPGWNPACAARHAPNRGDFRHRRKRHLESDRS
jgi:molecular chaperone DnaK (HSP70)